jgi:hypothetical protein
MYNRQQRRQMEKSMGLMKSYAQMSETQKAEVRKRRAETGKQIHLQNQQAREQYEMEFETEQHQKRINMWVKLGLSPEEATTKADEEYERDMQKWEKRRARKNIAS